MVDRNIINQLGITEEDLEIQVNEMLGDKENELLEEVMQEKVDSSLPGSILKGRIVTQLGNDVIIEVGLKSEGVVDVSEFDEPEEIEPGRGIEVLLEDIDSSGGLILLSKRKADRIRGWETIINTKKEGDVVSGKVIRRIKGGLLVDIGVPVFLPASQVDIRKPGDISRFIGKEVDCKILKIDIEGHNIVVSRRKLIEEERRESKEKIISEIEVGQLRKGIVKNIADFGVFVDLGGVDGLLHISDLSWGRISHPSEVVSLDQEIECVVIGFEKENEKISLGLKQKTESPWENVEERYPIGQKVNGRVVNVMNYGVFIRLEDGIEGLVHISEMSWTKRLTHPSEMLNLGDEIEVVVLNVNKDKQEISLGLKQTETNPWAIASQKYPPGTIVTATVRSTTNYGAFVEIEPGIDGMIHISDLSWTKKYSHPSEALQKSEQTKCVVLDINVEKQHISLGVKQMTEDPWKQAIPQKYIPGHIIKGKVTKITNFGAFVELESDLEGLLHISELADHKIDKPQDIVKESDEIEVKILKVDTEARKIGLSLRRAQWAAEDEAAEVAKQSQPPLGVQTVLSEADTEQLAQTAIDGSQEPKPDAEVSEETKTLETQSAELETSQPQQEVQEPEKETSENQIAEKTVDETPMEQEKPQDQDQPEQPKEQELETEPQDNEAVATDEPQELQPDAEVPEETTPLEETPGAELEPSEQVVQEPENETSETENQIAETTVVEASIEQEEPQDQPEEQKTQETEAEPQAKETVESDDPKVKVEETEQEEQPIFEETKNIEEDVKAEPEEEEKPV
ncbi:MAG: 30S ribosomal protein S1 [Planctomycetota bacterium]|jgi:small subunit ribosomal protein S1